MKGFRIVSLAAILIAIPMFSFASTRKSINIDQPVRIGSQVLKPGQYKVEWNGAGPAVQVDFMQGKKTVAQVPATLKQQENPYDGALELSTKSASNAQRLDAIDFKNMALMFNQNSPAIAR